MPYTGTFLRVLSIGSISTVQLRTMPLLSHTQAEQAGQDKGQQQYEANGKLSAFANGWLEGLAGGSLPEFGERCGRHGYAS